MHSKYKTAIYVSQTLIALLPIILGGLIYILWRPVDAVFFEWIKMLGFEEMLHWREHNFSEFSSYSPQWIIYSLPDGLWAFSYTFIIIRIWSGINSKIKFFWIATIPLFIIGLEVLQLTNLVRGTFSIPDLIVSVFGILFGIFTASKITKTERK